MRLTFATLFICILSLPIVAQDTTNQTTNMNHNYLRQASEVTGKTTAFTEIIIHASPEEVRAKFLAFEKWSEWNTVIPKIAVYKGDINDLSTKPTLDLVLNFGRKNDPAPAPVHPKVIENSPEVFNWGFSLGLVKAVHVFIFEPVDGGTSTRLVHYEQISGMLKGLAMNEAMRDNMVVKYNEMNAALKVYCEASN